MCLPVYYLDRWLSLLIVCCLPYWPCLPTDYPLCLLPALTHCSATVHESVFSTLPSIPLLDICLSDHLFVSIKLQVDLTTLPLHYRRLRHLRSSGFISATQLNHGLHRPTPTSSPGRPVHWGVCPPVLGAVVSGTVVRRIFVQRLVLFRAQWTQQIPVGQISVSWWGV